MDTSTDVRSRMRFVASRQVPVMAVVAFFIIVLLDTRREQMIVTAGALVILAIGIAMDWKRSGRAPKPEVIRPRYGQD